MNRIKAGLTHLAISIGIAALVFAGVRLVWYPGPLFAGAGGRDLFFVATTVDVIIGPLITFIIFKPGKRGLKFDLATIAVLQVAALVFGLHVIWEARPVWVVFVKDRFELVRAVEIEPQDRAKARKPYDGLSWLGPRFAGARFPQDAKEGARLFDSAVFGGKDIQTYPQHYVDYREVLPDVRRRALGIAALRELNPGRLDELARLVAASRRSEAQLAFLPMRAGKRDLTVIVDSTTGEPLEISELRPWKYD